MLVRSSNPWLQRRGDRVWQRRMKKRGDRTPSPRHPVNHLLIHPSFLNTIFMAPKTPLPMPPATADLATTWAFIEDVVDRMMTDTASVPYAMYMNLYAVSFNYCTTSKMHSPTSSKQSVAGRCLSLFIFRPPFANTPCSWCRPDGLRFVQ